MSTAKTRTYAAGTTVSVAKTKTDIEHELERFGASAFGYVSQGSNAAVMFEHHDRRIRMIVQLPDRQEKRFTMLNTWTKRAPAVADKLHEQACRERWWAFYAVIKARLVAVETGIETFEQAFLAHTLLPNGATVEQWLAPQLDEVYASGQMPPLLPGSSPVRALPERTTVEAAS